MGKRWIKPDIICDLHVLEIPVWKALFCKRNGSVEWRLADRGWMRGYIGRYSTSGKPMPAEFAILKDAM
jgi:hypothetical protein